MLTPYSQVQVQLEKPGRKILADFARSAVRRELFALYATKEQGLAHLLKAEDSLLQAAWKDLQAWVRQLGVLDAQSKKTVLDTLIGLIISTAKDYPDVDKTLRVEAVQRLLARGFTGLFQEPKSTEG